MGILIKNNIVNQKGTPAFYESSLATRPVANIQGRMFIDTDNPSTGIYRDNGTSWDQVADPGAGTTGTLQQVTTNGSSTTIGISTSGNGIGIGTTIPASNRLDIHSATGLQATLNGTGTTNAALQLQLAGVGKWTIQNAVGGAANNFVITDVLNTTDRLTIKNTGQTFIGSNTTSSGLFVVNSSTSDNHYVAIGSNAPSYRLRDVGSGGALNCGLGISTAVNNFIQGSANGNFCFFNSSTTASPILFGIYDAGTGNTQEAVRISAARNLLIGSTTDSGEKLQITGTSSFSSTIKLLTSYLSLQNTSYIRFSNTGGATRWGYIQHDGTNLAILNDISSGYISLNGGNVLIGTTTDIGGSYKLQVSGNSYFTGKLQTPNVSNNDGSNFLLLDNPADSGGVKLVAGSTVGYVTSILMNPGVSATSAIYFRTASNDRFIIKNNGIVNIINTSVYATNALALAGGLVAGDIYKSATGVLSIVY